MKTKSVYYTLSDKFKWLLRWKIKMPVNNTTYTADQLRTAQQIYNFWTINGFSAPQACGLLAQADAESSLDPTAVGDKKRAFGLYQLHSDRADLIKEKTGIDVRALPPVKDQLAAVLYELNHTEHKAKAMILAANTAYDAGVAGAVYYERPNPKLNQGPKRGDRAQQWFDYFSNLT